MNPHLAYNTYESPFIDMKQISKPTQMLLIENPAKSELKCLITSNLLKKWFTFFEGFFSKTNEKTSRT